MRSHKRTAALHKQDIQLPVIAIPICPNTVVLDKSTGTEKKKNLTSCKSGRSRRKKREKKAQKFRFIRVHIQVPTSQMAPRDTCQAVSHACCSQQLFPAIANAYGGPGRAGLCCAVLRCAGLCPLLGERSIRRHLPLCPLAVTGQHWQHTSFGFSHGGLIKATSRPTRRINACEPLPFSTTLILSPADRRSVTCQIQMNFTSRTRHLSVILGSEDSDHWVSQLFLYINCGGTFYM